MTPLTWQQHDAIDTLSRLDKATAPQIAADVGRNPGPMWRTLQRLERLGLVTREPTLSRARVWSLTPAGAHISFHRSSEGATP